MESNVNLYIMVLMIISLHLTAEGTKLIYIPNTTITCNILHRCMHLLAQVHRMFSLCASTVSCWSLEGEQGCVCSEELSELDGNPMARELCRPISLELGGELVAAKHSLLSRSSDHFNLTSLGKCPQFRCDP